MKKLWFVTILLLAAALVSACSKDAVLGLYNSALMNLGDKQLTDNRSLRGSRTFGTDSYVGSYEAAVEDATFEEYLFGNTSIEREDGYELSVRTDIRAAEGHCELLLAQDGQDPVVLSSESGPAEQQVTLGPGSAYFILAADGFTGQIALEIS